jgi:hypothetical protein
MELQVATLARLNAVMPVALRTAIIESVPSPTPHWEEHMDFYRARLRLQTFKEKGRGLVAVQDHAPEELIERAPVFVVPADRFRVICDPKSSLGPLKARMVIWKKDDKTGQDIACIAFGLLSFCNHDENPNASFQRDYETKTLALIATRAIAAGEEITVKYKNPDIVQIGDWA